MGLLSFLFGGSKAANKYAATVAPQQQIATDLSNYGITQGKFNIDKALGDVDYLTGYFKDILTGTPDHILKDIDASSITQGFDSTLQQVNNNSVRGGMRAGTLANEQFDKSAAINRIIQSVRQSAPAQLQSLAQIIAGIGSQQLGVGVQSNEDVISIKNQIESVRQAEAARKAAIFGSVVQAAGAVAGGLAGGGASSTGGAGTGTTTNPAAFSGNDYFTNSNPYSG